MSVNIGGEILVNGSMPGGSDLSVNKMQTAALPSQKIFYFDHKNGIHRETNIRLADRPELVPDENGIYTAYT